MTLVNEENDLNKIKTEDESEENPNPQQIPYILNGELYEILKKEGENVTVKCCNCPPDRVYRGSVRSTGNFHMHIKRRHPDLLAKLHQMKVDSLLLRRDRVSKKRKTKKANVTPKTSAKKIKKEPMTSEDNQTSPSSSTSSSPASGSGSGSGSSSESHPYNTGLKIKSVYQKHQLQKQQEQQQQQQEQEQQQQQQEGEEEKQQCVESVSSNSSGVMDSGEILNPLNLILRKNLSRNLEPLEKREENNNVPGAGFDSSVCLSMTPKSSYQISGESIESAVKFSDSSSCSNRSALFYDRMLCKDSIKKEQIPNTPIDLTIDKSSSKESSTGIGFQAYDNKFNFLNAGVNFQNNQCVDVLKSIHSSLCSIYNELHLRNRFEIAKFKLVHPDFQWHPEFI